MKQSLQNELRDILGEHDEDIIDALVSHKQRRDEQLDQLARNTSVRVSNRLEHATKSANGWVWGSLTTVLAASVAVFIQLQDTTPVQNSTAVPVVATQNVPEVKHQVQSSAALTVASRVVPTATRVDGSKSVTDEIILEQEVEQQFVDLLAEAVTDETLWTVSNDDVDKILQEYVNEQGL